MVTKNVMVTATTACQRDFGSGSATNGSRRKRTLFGSGCFVMTRSSRFNIGRGYLPQLLADGHDRSQDYSDETAKDGRSFDQSGRHGVGDRSAESIWPIIGESFWKERTREKNRSTNSTISQSDAFSYEPV